MILRVFSVILLLVSLQASGESFTSEELKAALPSSPKKELYKDRLLATSLLHGEYHDGQYRITNEYGFWQRLLTLEDAGARDYFQKLLKLEKLPKGLASPLASKLGKIVRSDLFRTVVFETQSHSGRSLLDVEQLKSLEILLSSFGLKVFRWQGFVIAGDGVIFQLVNSVLLNADDANDQPVIRRLKRTLKNISDRGISLGLETSGPRLEGLYRQQQLEIFINGGDSIVTLLHEDAHDRFSRFAQKLSSWMQKMGYIMPPELASQGQLDPMASVEFNLLDEINAQIEGYRKAGRPHSIQGAIEALANYPSLGFQQSSAHFRSELRSLDLSKRTVALWVFEKIRRFNRMTDEEREQYGKQVPITNEVPEAPSYHTPSSQDTTPKRAANLFLASLTAEEAEVWRFRNELLSSVNSSWRKYDFFRDSNWVTDLLNKAHESKHLSGGAYFEVASRMFSFDELQRARQIVLSDVDYYVHKIGNVYDWAISSNQISYHEKLKWAKWVHEILLQHPEYALGFGWSFRSLALYTLPQALGLTKWGDYRMPWPSEQQVKRMNHVALSGAENERTAIESVASMIRFMQSHPLREVRAMADDIILQAPWYAPDLYERAKKMASGQSCIGALAK